jgi:hypothetical protein
VNAAAKFVGVLRGLAALVLTVGLGGGAACLIVAAAWPTYAALLVMPGILGIVGGIAGYVQCRFAAHVLELLLELGRR